MEPEEKNTLELSNLNVPNMTTATGNTQNAGGNGETLHLPSPGTSYGSTLSIAPDASTANLLRIDLERKINRHTGEERETWDSRAEFLLSLVGYAVGLGNVWRFPYLTQKNGGGAFLIPYAIMLAIEGIPLFYLELAIGQRLRKGAVGCWNQVSPLLQGLGLASAAVSFNVALYYNTIIAWCILYFVQSFQSPLPWSECPLRLIGNTTIYDQECEVPAKQEILLLQGTLFCFWFSGVCVRPSWYVVKSGATTYFWYRETLNIAPSVEAQTTLNWKMALALMVAWIIVYLCMIKGIKSSGKVVYVTATFPYLVLIIFFFRGITLRGFERGLEHLFIPKWHKLLDPAVWLDAATQIFYSFGLAFGCLIALASYNPIRSNFVHEALIVTIADFFTSIFTASVVFCILGFKATVTYENCLRDANSTISNTTDVTKCDFTTIIQESGSGTGLAFIAFTEAINQFPVAQLWSILFFLMLFTLGLDSMFGTLEGALTSIYDMMLFPTVKREIICGVVCLLSFVISLCFATSTGAYVFALFDSFCANIPLLCIAFFECIAISYIYGLKRLSNDIEMMIGSRPSYFWLLCWRYLGPLAMIVIFVASLIEIFSQGSLYEVWDSTKGYTLIIPWPWWCQLLAAILILSSVAWIPGVALAKHRKWISLKDEVPAFFPEEELTEERNIKPHQSNQIEKLVFGFK